MKTVSIILPAARSLQRTQDIVDSFHCGNHNVIMDLIVSSPSFTVINAKNIRDNMIGNSKATAQGFRYVKGDYVGWWSDECMPTPGCVDNMVRFIDSHPEPFIGEFMAHHKLNKCPTEGKFMTYEVVGHQYARWGLMTRDSIGICGGFIDPNFRSFWGDVEISLRCWRAGGQVITCQDAVIDVTDFDDHVHTKNKRYYEQEDTNYMIWKWMKHYPVMSKEPWPSWNIAREVALA